MPIKPILDKYWRVNNYHDVQKNKVMADFKQRTGIDDNKVRTKEVMVRALQKLECGLPAYEKFTDKELEKCVKDRKIQPVRVEQDVPGKGAAKYAQWRWRQRTIVTLQAADEINTTFDRFMDLPPEIRVRIYHFHIGAFGDKLTNPTHPPLARTCRQLRNELLPVFYSRLCFVLEYAITKSDNGIRPDLDTRLFLQSVPDKHVANIRRLETAVVDLQTGKTIRHLIDLDAKRRTSVVPVRLPVPNWYTGTVEIDARQQLLDLVLKLEIKEGRRQFKMKDIHGQRCALEAALVPGLRKRW